jgi:hypothetical protein
MKLSSLVGNNNCYPDEIVPLSACILPCRNIAAAHQFEGIICVSGEPIRGVSMVEVTCQPIRVGTSMAEEDGRLVLVDGKLVAVLVRPSDVHPQAELHGQWFVAAGFGPIFEKHEVFPTLEDAVAWAHQTSEHRARWQAEQTKLGNRYQH